MYHPDLKIALKRAGRRRLGETSDDVYVIAEAVAEELATEHCGFYSDKKQGVVAAPFISQIYRPWGLTTHRGWARLVLDRWCLVEFPNAPRHRAERAHAEADYGEETAFDNLFNPEAGQRAQLMPRRRPALYISQPRGGGGRKSALKHPIDFSPWVKTESRKGRHLG